jgi:hypothetical protein
MNNTKKYTPMVRINCPDEPSEINYFLLLVISSLSLASTNPTSSGKQ